jgi:predicted transcriptional regulator
MSNSRASLHCADVRFALVDALRKHPLRFSSYQIAKILRLNWCIVKYYLHDSKCKARWRAAGK